MIEIFVSTAGLNLLANAPYILQSCVLVPPTTPIPAEPQEVVSTPVPPGVTYESLPIINTETQIIDTSPDQVIGCANELPVGEEQGILEALFPDAIDGDGVVNRNNNDVWVYDSGVWSNVGPTPGPQLVVVSVLPPWNEIVILNGITKTRVQISSFNYPLSQDTEIDSTIIKTQLIFRKTKILKVSVVNINLTGNAPGLAQFARLFGKVVEAVYYRGSAPDPQTLFAQWPVGMAIIGTISSSNNSILYDRTRQNDGYWLPRVNTPEQFSGPGSVEYLDQGISVGENSLVNSPFSQYYAWLFYGLRDPVINSNGTIQSTVYNSEVFSITRYIGNGVTGSTVGHGLGATPDFFFIKNLALSSGAIAGGRAIGGQSWYMLLSSSIARQINTSALLSINDQVVSLGSDASVNASGSNLVLYSFKEKVNRSKINFYTGNGLASGQHIDCGFKVGFLIIKARSNRNGAWIVVTEKMLPKGRKFAGLNIAGELTASNQFYALEGNGFRVFDETPNTLGVDTLINSFGIEYMYVAFAAGFYSKIFCDSVDTGLAAGVSLVASGVTVAIDSLECTLLALPPPYAGKKATVAAMPLTSLRIQLPAVVVNTGVAIIAPLVNLITKASPVRYIGQVDNETLIYLSVVESRDGEPLESSVKGVLLRFVKKLKDLSLWNEINTLNLLCGARTLNGALVPLKGTYPEQPSAFGSFNYNRVTGLRSTNANFVVFTNVLGVELLAADNHIAVYVTQNTTNTATVDLIGNFIFTSGGIGLSKSGSAGGIISRNNGSSSNTTVAPHWSAPSLIGTARSNTSNYTVRVAKSNRTIANTSLPQSSLSTSEIRVYSHTNNFGDFRIPVYSIGKSLDLASLEGEIEIFLADLKAVLTDTVVFIPTVSLSLQPVAPTIPRVIAIQAFETTLALAALSPRSAGRPRTVVSIPEAAFVIDVVTPVASGGAFVQTGVIDISLTIKDAAVVIREPGFGIAPTEFGLSSQPAGISFGNFPLVTS
jgi:hypothetical protein